MIKLYKGNCIDIIPALEKNSVDMVCIDPPYGATTIDWDKIIPSEKLWEMINYISKPNANIIIFGTQPFTTYMIQSNIKAFKYELIWDKNKCGSPGLAKYRPLKVHENIMIFNNGKSYYNPIMEEGDEYHRVCKNQEGYGTGKNTHKYGFGNKKVNEIHNYGLRYPKSILHCSRNFSAQQTVHPTQKPTTLLNWLIMTYSKPNDTIIDFCMGSGSCGVSAKQTGRNFIGIELDENYFNIAKNRIENAIENCITINDKQLTTQYNIKEKKEEK